MSSHRPLLPAPQGSWSGNVTYGPLSTGAQFVPPRSNPARRTLTHAACGNCRRRKAKCDGLRPACQACTERNETCAYEIEEGETRAEALRNRNQMLERDLFSAIRSLRALREQPPLQADDFYRRLRSGQSFGDLLEPQLGRSAAPSEPSPLPALTPRPKAPEPQPAQLPWANVDPVLAYFRSHADDIEHAFNLMTQRSAMMFYIYTPAQVRQLLSDLIRSPHADVPHATLCEACSIASLGAHFSRDQIPAATGDLLYAVTKHFLDDVIIERPLRATKVCAMLVLSNIVTKATVALSYAEMGLTIARSQGLYADDCPHALDSDVWVDAKRVWRTLILCKSWLETSLGIVPITSASSPEFSPQNLCFPSGTADMPEFFRVEFTKVSLLKSKILETATQPVLNNESLEEIRQGLSEWYDALPDHMSLQNLLDNEEGFDTRVSTYYLHLFHLGSYMLLHRCVISLSLKRRCKGLEDANIESLDSAQVAEDGLSAARLSGRILYLLLIDENAVVRHSWVCIYQSYTSCCILLWGCFDKCIQQQPRAIIAQDAEVTGRAMEALAFCAALDPVARLFHEKLAPFLSTIQAILPILPVLTEPGGANRPANLCFSPLTEGPLYLFTAREELLQLLSEPLSAIPPSTPSKPSIGEISGNVDEMGLGMHLEWGGLVHPQSRPLANDQLPFGWKYSRTNVEYISDASTLNIS